MLKNPYGLRDGKIVTVDDVPSGLACGCICPNPYCGARLVARHCNGSRQSNFSHYKVADCFASYETALHLLAKEILGERMCMMFPLLKITTSRSVRRSSRPVVERILVDRKLHHFDRADVERWMEGRVPDVVLYKEDRPFLVEIVVTHDIDEEKLGWIRSQNYSTIRVDLTWADRAITREWLEHFLTTGTGRGMGHDIVEWVHHAELKVAQQELDDAYVEGCRQIEAAVMRKNGCHRIDPPTPKLSSPPEKKQRLLFDRFPNLF